MGRRQEQTDDAGAALGGSSPRLYQRIVEILTGEIGKGAALPQRSLTETSVARRFGVSRAPARRALAELEQAGLVERSELGAFVPREWGSGTPKSSVVRDAPASAPLKLVSTPSWERIYGEVESDIIARTSFATWRVNEAELARHYGVSRTVARDVIGRLQQRGVVQKDDRSRWYAPALTADHVGELYELRWLLEPVALAKAAPNLPDGLLSRTRQALDEALAMAPDIDGATLDKLERDLHITLLGHCMNRALMQAITLPQSLLIAHRFLYRWTARLFETEPLLPEHIEIVDRLQAGHVSEAAKALERHLKVSRERAIGRIDVIARGTQPDPLSYLDRLIPAG